MALKADLLWKKARYGKDFSIDKYGADIKKTENAIKLIAVTGYSDNSAIQVKDFLKSAYER